MNIFNKLILISFFASFLLGCNNVNDKSLEKDYFVYKEFTFPPLINEIIEKRTESILNDKNVNGLCITFCNSFDSIRFIINEINYLDFLKNYPPEFYYKNNDKFIFIYSGIEKFMLKNKTFNIPKEISDVIKEFSLEKIRRTAHSKYVKYSYFTLDTIDIKVIESPVFFNEFLPVLTESSLIKNMK